MTTASPDSRHDVFTTDQVCGFDRRAIDKLAIPGFELMQRAAAGALAVARHRWPDARTLAIYCGGGNNGGDGYVLAALAAEAGLTPVVIAATDPDRLAGDAAAAFRMASERDDVRIVAYADERGQQAATADLVVDAMLGTGLERDVAGSIGEAVQRLNAAQTPILAIDIPTGLDSDTGAIRGVAVAADATATFVGLKSGLYLGRGPACCGDIAFFDLGLPAAAYGAESPVMRLIARELPGLILEKRTRISHKGLNGRVLVVGGSPGMPGAARLAAESALRAGAGLVHAVVAPGSVEPVLAARPEVMCRAVDSPQDAADWIESADVIVLGPGLGVSAWGAALAEAVLATDKPLVVDADGLNHLARQPVRRENWVLTPHPGEAGRLLEQSTGEIQGARREAVLAIVERFGGFAVLKGACSLVAGADGVPGICDAGNPGMATAGMGDVLAGVIGGLIAQFGLSREIVECAVLVHALAGDDAARAGERGLLASDLMACLRQRVNPQ